MPTTLLPNFQFHLSPAPLGTDLPLCLTPGAKFLTQPQNMS